MRTARTTAFVVAVLLMMTPIASAAIVLQEDFNGLGNPLNGLTVSTVGSAVWEAGDTWLDDGTAGTSVASSANGQAAHLDFTPQSGNIYTLSARYLNDQANWIAVGFMPTNPPGGDWTVTDFSVRHSNNGAYAWVLNRNSTGNDQEGFRGANAGNNAFGGDFEDPTQFVTVDIVLDTRPATWTAEFYLNGTLRGSGDIGAGGNPGIGGVGFSHDRSSTTNTGGVLDYLILDCVPEPGSVMLTMIALGGLGGLVRRRR